MRIFDCGDRDQIILVDDRRTGNVDIVRHHHLRNGRRWRHFGCVDIARKVDEIRCAGHIFPRGGRTVYLDRFARPPLPGEPKQGRNTGNVIEMEVREKDPPNLIRLDTDFRKAVRHPRACIDQIDAISHLQQSGRSCTIGKRSGARGCA